MECWSGARNGAGVLECWPSLMLNNAGPEAGIPMGATMDIENWVLEGGWRRVLAENGCAQLHAFTRIYTILHTVLFSNITSTKSQHANRQPGIICRVGHDEITVLDSGCRLLPPFAAFRRLFTWGADGEMGNRRKRPAGRSVFSFW